LNDYFTFDSKFLGSIAPLLAKPGFLTKEYLEGHRVKYIPPLRLFIFTSIIFFLLIGLSGQSEWKAMGGDQLQEEKLWDDFFSTILPKLFFLFLPIFALLVRLFFGKKEEGFTGHFLFSAHFHSFVFLLGCFYWLTSKMMKSFDLVHLNWIILLVFTLYLFVYLFIAIRRVYPMSFGKTLLRYLGLGALYGLAVTIGAMLAVLTQVKV